MTADQPVAAQPTGGSLDAMIRRLEASLDDLHAHLSAAADLLMQSHLRIAESERLLKMPWTRAHTLPLTDDR
jgi:hypothetical protein